LLSQMAEQSEISDRRTLSWWKGQLRGEEQQLHRQSEASANKE
jgi:hypothetical protein